MYAHPVRRTGLCGAILLATFIASVGSPTTAAVVKVLPDTSRASYIYDTITVQLTVREVDSLYGFAADLAYDPILLDLLSVTERDFLRGSAFDSVPTSMAYSQSYGKLIIGLSQIAQSSPGRSASGDTALLSLKFRVKAFGACSLTLSNVGLVKPDGLTAIPVTTVDGRVRVQYPALNTRILMASDPDSVGLSDQIVVTVSVDSVDRLHGFSMDLAYPSQILTLDSIAEGMALNLGGLKPSVLEHHADPVAGALTVGGSILANLDSGNTITAPTALFTCYFTAIEFGTPTITATSSALIAPNGTSIYPVASVGQCSTVVIPASQSTAVGFSPSDTLVFRTQQFRIALTVDDVDRLFGYSADLLVPPEVLRVDSVSEGPIWNSAGYQSFFDFSLDTLSGHLLLGGSILSAQNQSITTSQPLPLAYIFLTALKTDSVSITIDSIGLLAPNGMTRYPVASVGACNVRILPTSELVIQPTGAEGKDTYVSQSSPAANYGNDTALLVHSGASSAQSLVDFSIDALGENAIVSSAQLHLYGGKVSTKDTVKAYTAASSWNELSATWSNRPDTAMYLSQAFQSSLSWWTWDVTAAVRSWTDSTSTQHGLLLRPRTNYGDQLSFFSSEDTASPDRSPKLVVNYYYPPTCPDLVIAAQSIRYSSNPIVDGDTAEISVDVYNTGATAVGNVIVKFYEGVPQIGQYTLISQTILPAIRNYGYTTASARWSTEGKAGPRTIFVWVNSDNQVAECDTLNNKMSFFPTVLPKPNLSVTCADVTYGLVSPIEGDVLPLLVVIRNTGGSPVAAYGVTVDLRRPGLADHRLGQVTVTDQLGDGGRDTLLLTWPTIGLRGSYGLVVTLDSAGQVRESIESDNIINCPVTIFNPSLLVSLAKPSSASPNDTVRMSIRVQNASQSLAKNVITTVTLPVELNVISSVPAQDSGHVGRWTIDSLVAGAETNIQITTIVSPTAVPGGIVDIASRTDFLNRNGLAQNPVITAGTITLGADITPAQVLMSIVPLAVKRDSVRINCSVSELLQGSPMIIVTAADGDTLSGVLTQQSSQSFRYAVWVSDSVAHGQATVAITTTDWWGNIGHTLAHFAVDHSAPGMSLVFGDTLSLGTHSLKVVPTEALAQNPLVSLADSAGQSVTVSFVSKIGSEYTYQCQITGTTSRGWAHLSVQLADQVGNATSYFDSVYIVTDRPRIQLVMPTRLPKGNSTILVRVNKRLKVFPEIRLFDAGSFQVKLTGPSATDTTFAYTCKVDSMTAEGMAQLYVKVTDLFGNWSDTTTVLLVDRTPPVLAVSPSDTALTGVFSARVDASEPLAGAPIVTISDRFGLSAGAMVLDSTQFSLSYFYSGTSVAGVSALYSEAADLAGNVGRGTAAYSDLAVSADDIKFSAIPGTGQPVTIRAYIHNLGAASLDSVSVDFWLGYPGHGTRIGGANYIAVAARDSSFVEIPWWVSQQSASYAIYIVVDGQNRFRESNELNNTAWRGSIAVSAYLSKVTYLNGVDSVIELHSRVYSRSTGQALVDSQVMVRAEIRDTLGTLILGPVELGYDSSGLLFTYTFDIRGLSPKQYRIIYSADAGGGTGVVRDSILIQISQQVGLAVATGAGEYYRGDSILISGLVKYADQSPAVGLPITCLVMAKGGTRAYDVLSSASGHFETLFIPHYLEAGYYMVIAQAFLGSVQVADTVSFTVQGLLNTPTDYNVDLSRNSSMDVTFVATNIGTRSLRMDSARLAGPPVGQTGMTFVLSTGAFAQNVTPQQSSSFSVQIWASPTAVASSEYEVVVFFEDSLQEHSRLHIKTQQAAPHIVVTPSTLEYYMNPGTTLTRQLRLRNDGFTTWRDLQAQAQVPQWLQVRSDGQTDSLAVGGELLFDLTVAIPEAMPLGVYDTSFSIQSSNYPPVTVPVRTYVTAGTTGAAAFLVLSEQGSAVEGARIQLYSQVYDPTTHSYPVYQGITDIEGRCLFANVAANQYQYKVEAENFQSVNGYVTVGSGTTGDVPDTVILRPQSISVEWSVTDTTVSDSGKVTLTVQYNTTQPVLLIVPHVMAHSGYRGDEIFGSFQLVNIGKYQADQITIAWPENEYFSASQNGSLPAALGDGLQVGEEVTINYVLRVKETVEMCQTVTDWLHIVGSFDRDGYLGSTEAYGQFHFSTACDGVRIEPPAVITVDLPCALTDDCQCDFGGWVKEVFWRETIIHAINEGYGAVHMRNLFGFEVSVPLPTSPADLFLAVPSGIDYGRWNPPDIIEGQTSEGRLLGLNPNPVIGVTVKVGAIYADWKNLANQTKFRMIPVIRLGLHDLGLSMLFDCLLNLNYTPPTCNGCLDGGNNIPQGSWSTGLDPIPGPTILNTDGGGYVTLRIDQRVSVERQAFSASLELRNDFDSYAIENLDVNVIVEDVNGFTLTSDQHVASGPLFFAVPDLNGLADIDGGGSLTAQTLGTARWLIIPKTDAGGTQSIGTKYRLRAQISYTIGGVPYSYTTESEEITVLPQPKLELCYYLPRAVNANVPFSLAVSVKNAGYGSAHNLKIDSDQPIVLKGSEYLSRFEILETEVAGEPRPGSLAISFGDLLPGQNRVGYWTVVAAPSGSIDTFTASYRHSDALGGSSTSLVTSVSTAIICRDHLQLNTSGLVKMRPQITQAASAGFRGMLVDNNADAAPDAVLEVFSGQLYSVVATLTDSVHLPSFEEPVQTVFFRADENWTYVRFTDAFAQTKTVSSITRRDGSEVPSTNYWTDSGFVYVCDLSAGNNQYTVVYASLIYKPDLTIPADSISFTPCPGCGTINAGDSTVTINFQVHNLGNLPVGGSVACLYSGHPGEGVLLDSIAVDSIDAGHWRALSWRWHVGISPDSALLFYQRVFIVADSHNRYNELSEENNMAEAGVDLNLLTGDANHDEVIDIRDVQYLADWIFRAGNLPIPSPAGDLNCDEIGDIRDVVSLVWYVFRNGSEPCNHRGPGQKPTVPAGKPGAINLALLATGTYSYILTVKCDFAIPVAGLQQNMSFDRKLLVVDSIRADAGAAGLTLAWSARDTNMVVGLLDLSGRKQLASGPRDLFKMYVHCTRSEVSPQDALTIGSTIAVDSLARQIPAAVTVDWKSSALIPEAYFLTQNYPNPFNPSTSIKFGLPRRSQVKLTVINILGQEVRVLVDDELNAGVHKVVWDGKNNRLCNVASGVYFYRIRASEFVQSKKMLLIK